MRPRRSGARRPSPARRPRARARRAPGAGVAAAPWAGLRRSRSRRARRPPASGGSSSRPRSALVRQRVRPGRERRPEHEPVQAQPLLLARQHHVADARPASRGAHEVNLLAVRERGLHAAAGDRQPHVRKLGQAVAQQLLAERHLDAVGSRPARARRGRGPARATPRPAGRAPLRAGRDATRGRTRSARARRAARPPPASRAARACATRARARRPAASSKRTRASSGSAGATKRERLPRAAARGGGPSRAAGPA